MGTPDYSQWEDITDEYVPQDTPSQDYNNWEDVTDEYITKPNDSPGWLESIGAATQKGIADLVTSGGQVMESAGRSFSEPGTFWGDVGSGLENLGRMTKETYDPYSQYSKQVLSKIPEDSWKKTTANVTEGLANAFPMLGASAGSLPVMLGYNALNRFGRTTKDLEDQGISPEQAEGTGATSAILNAPLDAIFMSPIFNKGTAPLRKTVESTLSTMAGAFPQRAADLEARSLAGLEPDGVTAEKVFDDWGNVLLETGISGGLMGAGMSMMHPRADATGDYFSNKSSKEGITNWESKLNVEAQQKALADAEMTVANQPEVAPTEQIPDIINPEGDVAQQRIFEPQESSTTKNRDFIPEETGRAPEEFTRPDYVPPEFVPASNDPNVVLGRTPDVVETKTVTKTEPVKQPLAEDGASVKISTVVPKNQLPPVDEGALNAIPVEEMSVDAIEHLPEIPNMKRKATGKGGTIPGKELKGGYSRLPQNPITVLETADGKIGIVTGRHRLRLAQESGEKTIPVQKVREVDGYTKEWARMFDAEQNIRDGQGEIDDYANYFRQAKLSPEEASERGLMRDEKGQQGYAIGTHGSPEVFDGYMNGILSSKQAASIAMAAPGNEAVQRAGIKLAMSGTNVDQLPNAIKQLQQISTEQISNTPQAEQVDMFGADDRVMKLVMDQSNAAAAKIKEIDQKIYAVRGAAKNPEAAKSGGVAVEDAKATKAYIDQLQQEKTRWQNWVNDPELRQQLNQEFTSPEITSDPVVAAEKFDIVPDEQTGLFQIDNSSDVIPAPIKKPFTEPQQDLIVKTEPVSKPISDSPLTDQAVEKNLKSRLASESGAIRFDMPNLFTSDGFKDFISRMQGKGIEKNPEFYNFFKSKRNLLASTITKADKFPWYRKNHEAVLKNYEMENSISWDHDQMLRPFTLLNAKEKQNVSSFLYAALRKGPNIDLSPENLTKLGLSNREIRGVQSVRNTMDSALESLRDLAVSKVERSGVSEEVKAQRIAELNQHFDVMKASNFVPTGRYGKYGLTLYDGNGKVVSFTMNDSKAKLANMLYEAIRKDPSIDPIKSRVAPVAKALGSEYVGAHPDIMDIMQDSDAHIPSASFENRFKKRELIEGFEADLQRNIASYLTSFAKYVSSQRTKQAFADNNKAFDAFYKTLGNRDRALYTGLRKNIDDLQRWAMEPVNSSTTSKAFAYFYLANAFKTAAVNTTSFFTSTYPKIAKYTQGLKNITGKPEQIFGKSIAETALYYGKKAITGIKPGEVGKDLWASLEAARKEGVVGGNRVMKDLLTNANRPTAKGRIGAFGQKISAMDLAFFLNGTTEDFVRTNAYITGWNTYPYAEKFFKQQSARNNRESNYKDNEGRIPIPDRHTFAKNFVRETQADYTKAGTPDFAKNPVGKLASTFRLYHHAYFTSLKRSVMERQFGAASRYIGALGALGGIAAIPLAGGLMSVAKQVGFDPDKSIKEGLEYFGVTKPQTKQMIMYGLPTHPSTNLQISGAISPDIIPPELMQGDIVGGLGKAFLGVLADPIDRIGRSWYYYDKKGDTPRALEQLFPPAFNIQHNITANRWAREGVLNAGGEDILGRMPTEGEIFLKRFGFTPATIAAAMDQDLALKRRATKLKDNENINTKIARAMVKGTSKDVEYWENYADEKGLKRDNAAIMKMVREMEDPDRALYNRFGRHNMDEADKILEEYKDLINPKQ